MKSGVVVFIGDKTKKKSPMNEKIDKIVSSVVDYYGVDVYEKSRKMDIVFARQVAMFFLRTIGKIKVIAIAQMFEKDHSSVIYSVKQIYGFCEVDPDIKDQIKQIEQIILVP